MQTAKATVRGGDVTRSAAQPLKGREWMRLVFQKVTWRQTGPSRGCDRRLGGESWSEDGDSEHEMGSRTPELQTQPRQAPKRKDVRGGRGRRKSRWADAARPPRA